MNQDDPMRSTATIAGTVPIVISVLLAFIGLVLNVGYPSPSPLGNILLFVSASTLVASSVFATFPRARSFFVGLKELAARAVKSAFVLALLGTATVLLMAAIGFSKENETAWAVGLSAASILAFASGNVILLRSMSSRQSAPEIVIDPESLDDPKPASPPDPRIDELLHLKKQLKEEGRT
jgi:hypothetical protein